MNREQMLEEALRNVRACLGFENEKPNGPIRDTIWYSNYETLFDYIDSTLEALSTPAEPRTVEPLTVAELDQIAMEDKGQGVYWYRGFLRKACERLAAKNGLVLAGGERG